jgi:hypothetical protein
MTKKPGEPGYSSSNVSSPLYVREGECKSDKRAIISNRRNTTASVLRKSDLIFANISVTKIVPVIGKDRANETKMCF